MNIKKVVDLLPESVKYDTMNFKIKDVYSDGSEMVIRAGQLDHDLRRRGYDTEHINYIITAIYDKVTRDGDKIERDDLASIWQ